MQPFRTAPTKFKSCCSGETVICRTVVFLITSSITRQNTGGGGRVNSTRTCRLFQKCVRPPSSGNVSTLARGAYAAAPDWAGLSFSLRMSCNLRITTGKMRSCLNMDQRQKTKTKKKASAQNHLPDLSQNSAILLFTCKALFNGIIQPCNFQSYFIFTNLQWRFNSAMRFYTMNEQCIILNE